ncbi:unnamed protein product [Adineta ricciae]|uniref:Helix-turn-helix domain-containing protein n=1 Tax=Adineta ricciae TaxID=249248 RepID=A0A814TVL8_ADIRI|nr:unnamed protein product [Adineta ricciae]
MMHLISTSYYILLQKDAWQDLHDFGTKNGTWPMKISKSIARDHCTCQMITPLKRLIEQCQMLKTEMMDKCVENGLRRLKDKFIYKKAMLQHNYDDQQAITKFYSLRPSKEQIHLAKKICHSAAVELKLDSSVIDDDECANLASRCSKTITQLKCDIMVLTLATMDNTIRGHIKKAAELKQKFLSDGQHRSQLATKELYDLSGHLNIRARYEHALLKNIRRLIDKQPHAIVRRTDKTAYMTIINAYEVFSDGKSPLHNSLTAVQTLLGALLQEKVIDKKLCSKLLPKMNNLELAHFHFIPKPHKPGTPLRPIIASINAPTTNISKFLNDLLTPLFLKVTRETTFTNNLYTMIPRTGALQALASFVEELWSPNQSSFFLLLSKYIDDIVMTTNLSIEEITNLLEKMQHKDPNISISYKIDSAIDFLDVAIENNLGHLKTSIFHKSSAESYILPYTSDHPHHIHRNIPYAALLRAARLCSNVRDFDMERIRIDVSLLLNDYPFDFISEHFQRFFYISNAQKVVIQSDQETYSQLHHRLLHQLSQREKQLQSMMQNYDQVPGALVVKPWNTKLMYPNLSSKVAQHAIFNQHFTNGGQNGTNIQVQL